MATMNELVAQQFPELNGLLPRLLEPDFETRRIALLELADEENEDYLPLLIAALADPAAEVRAEAARLLAGWEREDVLDALTAALFDESSAVKTASAQSLSELKTFIAGIYLLPWLNHSDAFVLSVILRALRELRIEQAAETALKLLVHENAEVRREAIGVLGWLKYSGALTQLAVLATNDGDADVRRAAVGALGMATDDSVLPALRRALCDNVWSVREEAAATLTKLKLAAAQGDLLAALNDEYWQVRLLAVRALGRMRAVDAVPSLILVLQQAVSNVRKEAAIALGEIGDNRAIAALYEAQRDSDPDVRKLAGIALSRLQTQVARA